MARNDYALEGRLMKQALDSSLPKVMEELVVQQRDQTKELEGLDYTLSRNEVWTFISYD